MPKKPFVCCVSLVVMLAAFVAHARPLLIDLSAEKKEYEVLAARQHLGVGLLVGSVVAAGAAYYGYTAANSAHLSLLAEKPPIDLSARQNLISSGETWQAVSWVSALLAIIAVIGSISAFAGSF